ncbi:MAG: L,D-transpeptidase family protein, partial [Nanobdellota archaeon]
YNIELGLNPFDDKIMEGDKCTPEGKYKVEVVKDRGETKFYKAFLINYPNNEDLARFEKLKRSGDITNLATPGSLIEIHGRGSGNKGKNKGSNWTWGCIALSNKSINELFQYDINKGTPVTIVKYGTKENY